MGPRRGVRGWVSVSKVSLEGLYGRVSLQSLSYSYSYRHSGQSWAGGITICGGPLQHDSTTLDVATKFIVRPDQFNLLLLGYCEAKIGSNDRKKAINWGVVIDHNLIKTG